MRKNFWTNMLAEKLGPRDIESERALFELARMGRPEGYRARGGVDIFRDRYIASVLDTLAELEWRTDPRGGDEASKNKDYWASHAIFEAAELFDHLAGWAVDHMIGAAISNARRHKTSDPSQDEAFEADGAAVDSHDNERRGSELRESVVDAALDHKDSPNPLLLRQILIALVGRAPLPWPMSTELREALIALGFGEAVPLLKPARTTRRIFYHELRLQLKAVAFVIYYGRINNDVEGASSLIADKYGVSIETVKSWRLRIREVFDLMDIPDELAQARRIANHMVEQRRMRFAGQEIEIDMSDEAERLFGSKVIQSAADRYREIQLAKGSAKGKRRRKVQK